MTLKQRREKIGGAEELKLVIAGCVLAWERL